MTSYTSDARSAMYPSNFAGLIDFTRRPRARRGTTRSAPAKDDAPVLIRRAAADDAPAIARLAALDERELPGGERLIALLGERPVAAVEVRSGASVADPFTPTAGIVELLGLRAAQVRR
jgi:hypothetical protein